MTIATFDLTEHTQMSIRGTTGTHPNSRFVFGVYICTDEIHAEQSGFTPDISAYDDMDWSKAAELAKWIDEMDKSRPPSWEFTHLTDTCVASYFPPYYCGNEDARFGVMIETPIGPSYPTYPIGSFDDRCEWERAVQMAKWIIDWDERFKEAEE